MIFRVQILISSSFSVLEEPILSFFKTQTQKIFLSTKMTTQDGGKGKGM